ncbi:TetR family transcriptional regulator [Sphingobium chungbukense]|uniref:TetR family transcriptional regulator n=2 Tax=Sphingomonadaceae TaxID=41297 RepID=A0A0M3AN55_9SPHN|nr:TetR family transcriptional regulator [Sphingobium chungbukense]
MMEQKIEGRPERARFVRESADVRRQALIEATARCLAEKGVGGTSVRVICAYAGVSAGLLTHYFDGVDALILATYRDVGEKVGAAMERAVAEAGPDPRDRLWAYLRANFQPPVLDPNLLATWISFWSLNKTNPAIAATHAETYGSVREHLEVLLREAAPQIPRPDARIAAIGLTAMVDGLWLELCLDSSTFTIQEALGMVEEAMNYVLSKPRNGSIDQ